MKGWLTRRRRGAQAGNRNSARHYAYARLAIVGEVAERVDFYLFVAKYLDPLIDGPALAACARLGVQAAHASAAIEAALAGGAAVPESLRKHCAYLLQAELRALAAVGLTPASRAQLGLAHLDAEERARRMTEASLAKYRHDPERKPDPR